MSAAERARPVTAAEAKALLAGLSAHSALVLAVSGGPDSVALMLLAARWRASLRRGPKLLAVTVDHRLRPESAKEARQVARLARELGVAHRILRWDARKPSSGLQQAARLARYRLLAQAAQKAGARHVLTAHTLDDQAETLLMRLVRGSGLSGLAAMQRETALAGITIVRPLLDIPKARLLATLRRSGVDHACDPSNRDPRFTRVRIRGLLQAMQREGLSPRRLALLAARIRRAEAALAHAVNQAVQTVSRGPWLEGRRIVFDAEAFGRLPQEISLRLLARAVDQAGDEGPAELGKLERLHAALGGPGPYRRTLAGAVVSRTGGDLVIERAPARRSGRISALTKCDSPAERTGFAG